MVLCVCSRHYLLPCSSQSVFSTGQASSSHDRLERARRGVSLRRSGFSSDRFEEPGDAPEGEQFPLPRAEARGHRRFRRLHQKRVEDAAELAQNLGP